MTTVHSGKAERTEESVLAQAIETLSRLADLDFSTITEGQEVSGQENGGVLKTVRWLHQKNAERLLRRIRATFTVFCEYFKDFQNIYPSDQEKKIALQGLKTIMFLVDEAADNFERYTDVFVGLHKGSVRRTPEFKKLCSLYVSKIEPLVTQYKIESLPIHGLFSKKLASTVMSFSEKNAKALVVPIEAVRQDVDYELLYLRKSDGSRYCSPALLRNLRLACDIEQISQKKGNEGVEDELEATVRDQDVHDVHCILYRLHRDIDTFFSAAHKAKDHPLMLQLYSACIALMMASVQGIHTHNTGGKEVHDYVKDFKRLLLNFYHDSEFKRLLAYPPANEKSWEYALLRLSEDMAMLVSKGLPLAEKAFEAFSTMLAQAKPGTKPKDLGEYLNAIYDGLSELTSSMKADMMSQMLHEIDTSDLSGFEPLLGGSLPTHLCNLHIKNRAIPLIRLPAPTKQEYVNKAYPSELFQAFLRACQKRQEKSLLINFNDIGSLKSNSRFITINELGEEWRNSLDIINLSDEGDFYNQIGVYEPTSSVEEFKNMLVEYFCGQSSIPHSLRDMFPNLEDELREILEPIHRYLFEGKNVLTKSKRLEWIDSMQLLIILKAIGQVNPARVFISCKDGIDITLPLVGGLSCLVWTLTGSALTHKDRDWLTMVEFGLPLMLRHRMVFESRYSRFMGIVSLLAPFSSAKNHLLDRHLLPSIEKFLGFKNKQVSLEPCLED
jgi:hypothetical protein